MDKEKEIEEMAYNILFYCEDEECDKCKYRDKINCRCFQIAETLINEGYGNKKQAVTEFAEEFHECCRKELKNLVYEYGEVASDVIDIFDNLVKELYGEKKQ